MGPLFQLRDLAGLPVKFVPDGLVQVDVQGAFVVPRPGDALAARVVRSGSGWVAALPLAFRGCPSQATVARWVAEEHARTGMNRPATMLATTGHVLVRRLCEWAWSAGARGPGAEQDGG